MLITRRSQVRDLHGALNFCFFLFFNSILFNFYLYLLSILYHVDSFIYPLFSTVVFSLYCFCFFLFLYLYSLYFFYLYLLSILYHIDTFIYPLSSTAVFSLYFTFSFVPRPLCLHGFCFCFYFFFTSILSIFLPLLGSVSVHCYGTTKSFILKTHGSHDKITILLN